jgi:hypothetical protein
MRQSSLADITTLGFAISLMTSARVALADCFFVFLFAISHDFRNTGRSLVNLDQVASCLKSRIVGDESWIVDVIRRLHVLDYPVKYSRLRRDP